MKLLFIDHECHKRTRSAEFFLDIIRKAFDVDEHYYSKCYDTKSEKTAETCDIAVIWEFPISRRRFFFAGKRNVFVPMYDNEWASRWQWKRIAWSGIGVISFCDKVTAHARRCGVKNILDVRYFPDPAAMPQASGDPKRVFLWERGAIGEDVARRLFPQTEGYTFEIKRNGEFLERDAYLARLAQCGVVVAPRLKEGIGMAFLEAMAMGKCVAANDDATMNEYIKDGENGFLFSGNSIKPIAAEAVAKVRENIASSASDLHERWLMDKEKINGFLLEQQPCRPSLLNMLKIALAYPLYLLEGAVHFVVQKAHKL